MIENNVVNAVKAIEDQIDAELHKLDNLQASALETAPPRILPPADISAPFEITNFSPRSPICAASLTPLLFFTATIHIKKSHAVVYDTNRRSSDPWKNRNIVVTWPNFTPIFNNIRSPPLSLSIHHTGG